MMSSDYENDAQTYQALREERNIGLKTVLSWSERLAPAATVLDVACGTGKPLAAGLADRGFQVFGVDNSPTLLSAFQEALPTAPAACEDILVSNFFGKKFDAIIAIGIIFLFSEIDQKNLLTKIAASLQNQGHFLLSAPTQIHRWHDAITDSISISLGKKVYVGFGQELGLVCQDELTDEGGNHYYAFQKLAN